MKAILVDDEALALRRLAGLLTELEDMEICGVFSTALEALDYIDRNPVDVVFLDISMPEMNGMEMANRLMDRDNTVQIVFVTGYEEYAVDAFELDAADYLLKPISRERLAKTVKRLKGNGKRSGQRLRVTCFGGFRIVTESGETIQWRTPKVEELFAFLICRRCTSREEIADILWDGLNPDKAMRNLNTTLYYVRKALQTYGMEECVITRHRELVIDTNKLSCDLYEFEALQKEGKQLKEAWKKFNRLYTGELFKGKTYEWSFAIARRQEAYFLDVLLKNAKQHEVQNQQEEAEKLYLRAIDLDYSEEAFERLMDIYRRTGQKRRMERLKQMAQTHWVDVPGISRE